MDTLLPILAMVVFIGVPLAILVAVLVWIFRRAKLQGVKCPKCGTHLPGIRAPSNVNDAVSGNTTCPKCGTVVNAKGEAVPSMSK